MTRRRRRVRGGKQICAAQAFPVVKLRRTNVKIVHKVANTVGRVMTTGINMANKSSSALQSQDQPELDARYVYVGVHADGPTRVMCFSETRDEYTRGTNEESVALLTQKLKALEVRNRVSSPTTELFELQNDRREFFKFGHRSARLGIQLSPLQRQSTETSMLIFAGSMHCPHAQ